jgi:hypothetical protein
MFSPSHSCLFESHTNKISRIIKWEKVNELYYDSHKNFKSNIKSSQYHYGSLDSQRIKLSALQVARFTSILLTFSDRIIVEQQQQHMTSKEAKREKMGKQKA